MGASKNYLTDVSYRGYKVTKRKHEETSMVKKSLHIDVFSVGSEAKCVNHDVTALLS